MGSCHAFETVACINPEACSIRMEGAHYPMLMFRMGAKEAERIVQAPGQQGMQPGVSLDGGTLYCKMRSHASIITCDSLG
jgi:hypothetical protein